MKQITVAGKTITLLFTALLVAGCASNEPTDAEAAVAAEAEARRQAEDRAATEAAAQRALEDAVAAAGNVVYFEFDSSALSASSRAVLDAHIALAKSRDGNIRLEGHADERGTREYNIALGERRAKSVADYMALNGVASHRVETVSFGEERPAAHGSGEAVWSQNRRVEIK